MQASPDPILEQCPIHDAVAVKQINADPEVS